MNDADCRAARIDLALSAAMASVLPAVINAITKFAVQAPLP
jgi:hypothetical protein